MSKFPQAVFTEGGIETSDDCEGHAFTSRLVNDDDELNAAKEAGAHESVADLVKAVKARIEAEKLAAQGKKDDDDPAAPTRAELEQKATELGVEFSAKLGDKKLAERIAEKLAAQGT